MLTADLVEIRRRGDQLSLRPLEDADREAALGFAEAYVGLVRVHVGRPRAQLVEALRVVPVQARQRRLAAGLCKLALDACTFEQSAGLDPAALRAEIFAEAARHRRALAGRAGFERLDVLAQSATRHGVSAAALEQALYADLPEAQILVSADLPGPRALVAAYEAGGVQAVLLRAVSVRVRVTGASAVGYRQLFRKLKFLRLLHAIAPLPPPRPRAASPGYEIVIDGPYSMFESVTRYGLKLALAYPAIAACGGFVLEADLRWGKDRRPLKFSCRGGGEPNSVDSPGPASARAAGATPGSHTDDATPNPEAGPGLPTEVEALLADLGAHRALFQARASERLIALPGAGVIAPDIELRHTASGRTVHVEVLGYWSRDAVWRRIELAARGLPEPIIFAVSKHLRVSEAALPEDQGAALYVYAHKLSARALVERATRLLATPQL